MAGFQDAECAAKALRSEQVLFSLSYLYPSVPILHILILGRFFLMELHTIIYSHLFKESFLFCNKQGKTKSSVLNATMFNTVLPFLSVNSILLDFTSHGSGLGRETSVTGKFLYKSSKIWVFDYMSGVTLLYRRASKSTCWID